MNNILECKGYNGTELSILLTTMFCSARLSALKA